MTRYVAGAVFIILSACAMTKPGMTPETKAKDRYDCEQQAYALAQGNPWMLSNGLFRDCMRARGYR